MDVATEPWAELMNCPIADRYSNFATFSISSEFYFFGGYKYEGGYRDTNEIWKFCELCMNRDKINENSANKTWFPAGRLSNARKGHGVTFFQGLFWVVGGQGDLKTEKCALSSDQVICENHDDYELNSFAFTPELFIVPKQFCQK